MDVLWMFYGCFMDVLWMFYGCFMDVLWNKWLPLRKGTNLPWNCGSSPARCDFLRRWASTLTEWVALEGSRPDTGRTGSRRKKTEIYLLYGHVCWCQIYIYIYYIKHYKTYILLYYILVHYYVTCGLFYSSYLIYSILSCPASATCSSAGGGGTRRRLRLATRASQRLETPWGVYPLVNIQKTMENHHFS